MRGEIIAAMAADMNIKKFNNETDLQFVQRVLYSATACWVKAAALDRNIGDENVDTGVSKKHIYEKVSKLLSAMLERYPETKYWFYMDDESEDPIRIIRRRLVQNGDLINVGFDTNMITTSSATYPIGLEAEQITGVFFDGGIFYSGLSAIRKSTNQDVANDDEAAVDWFDEFCKTAWWENGRINNDSIEYFNCVKNAKNIHSCWQKNEVDFFQNIRLIRITINKTMYEYYLEKVKGENIYHHKIDPFLLEIKEHRKMMFALRKKANTPLPAHITKHNDHATLNLWAHLPYEMRVFLESYAWPSRNINDVLEWNFPLCLLDEIKRKLNNLGMSVTEGHNG